MDYNENNSNGTKKYLVIDEQVLPEVFQKVVLAANYLRTGEASSTTEAVKMAGISRSVYYKYKDSVFPYIKKEKSDILTIQLVLSDRPGVLMNLLSFFYTANANILTVNQNIPVKGRAFVSISARIGRLDKPLDTFLQEIRQVGGVLKINSISD